MLTIGEFSKICKVSTKTLRYYEEIGILLPSEVNEANGYRYYSLDQLKTMLFINRLKTYHFSLEEIKEVLNVSEHDKRLYNQLLDKKKEINEQIQAYEKKLYQLHQDILTLQQGNSIMSYLDNIEIQIVEVPNMFLVSVRKKVKSFEMKEAYEECFTKIVKRIKKDNLTIVVPPMVLFHDNEFGCDGLDTEFAIAVKERAKGTRDFHPGFCLKTILHGSYHNLASIYTKQIEWAEREGYESSDALYEVYVNDPSMIANENELITEVYYPIKKKA